MKRCYYSSTISAFMGATQTAVLGELTENSDFDLGRAERDACLEQISILKTVLAGRKGSVYFEYSRPRMGKRVDVVLLIGCVVFVAEFKVALHTLREIERGVA